MARAGPVVAAVQRQRLLDAAAVAEEVRERIGQPEVRSELRAVVGAAEYPQLGAGGALRMRLDRPVRVTLGQRQPRHPRLQLDHLLRKRVGRVGMGIQRHRRQPVRPGRPADAQIDAPGRDGLQHAELLGHLQRRVVRQHHARAADADALRRRRDRRHQHLGRGADDAVAVVMLGHPVAVIAQRIAMARQRQRLADRIRLRPAVDRGRLIEHRQLQGVCPCCIGACPACCCNTDSGTYLPWFTPIGASLLTCRPYLARIWS